MSETDTMGSVEAAVAHRIKDEDLAADQEAIGIDTADPAQEYLSTATPESIRNFAVSYGDDNPLYCDPRYGEQTRWGGQVAPAIMAGILNAKLRGDPPDPRARGGRFKGIHVFASGFGWDFYQPVRPSDTVYAFTSLESSKVAETTFAGRAVFRTQRWVKVNQDAEVLAVHRMVGIYAERRSAKERGSNSTIELASYTDEELAQIDAIYAAEQRRGSAPRYWEDVEVGENLGQMAKGPFTITDIIRFHAGGYHLNDLRTSRLAWQNRQRKPAFYIPNDQGIPDVAQRVHWDAAWAQATGNPTSIDYGAMREYWLHHLLTDWAGDEGWVSNQHVELRKFSYLGDVHVLTGEVVGKRAVGPSHVVDVEMRATNQRRVATAVGTATIVLPSRNDGPAVPLQPDSSLRDRAKFLMERHHAHEVDADV